MTLTESSHDTVDSIVEQDTLKTNPAVCIPASYPEKTQARTSTRK